MNRLFQKAAIVVFTLFMSALILVFVIAFSRKTSGATGYTMSRIQEIRIAEQKKHDLVP